MNRTGNKRPYQDESNSDLGSSSKSRRVEKEKDSVDPQSFRGMSQIFSKIENHNQDPLSRKMWDLFSNQSQRDVEFNRKIDLWNIFDRLLSNEYGYSTHVFGSTINGFGCRKSDMDICVFPTRDKHCNKNSVAFLGELRRLLKRKCGHFLHGNIELIAAKVPILKMYDQVNQIEIDLSCANTEAVRNSHLLMWYSQMDWRIRPLVMNLKFWAKKSDINDAKHNTLSSYALTLMILHYLQCGATPPVIPSLQVVQPGTCDSNSNVFNLPFCSKVPKFTSENRQTLGSLLYGFFQYYNEVFDFTADCGSIRCARVLPIETCYEYSKERKDNPKQWEAYVCMEDPYTRINTGRAVMNRDKFDKILTAFSHAQKKLPACILQCKDCLSDRCELPFHEPTFHDPIDTAWSFTSSSNVTIVDNPYLNQRTTYSNQLPGQEGLYQGQVGHHPGQGGHHPGQGYFNSGQGYFNPGHGYFNPGQEGRHSGQGDRYSGQEGRYPGQEGRYQGQEGRYQGQDHVLGHTPGMNNYNAFNGQSLNGISPFSVATEIEIPTQSSPLLSRHYGHSRYFGASVKQRLQQVFIPGTRIPTPGHGTDSRSKMPNIEPALGITEGSNAFLSINTPGKSNVDAGNYPPTAPPRGRKKRRYFQ